jgi:hypothetical protein
MLTEVSEVALVATFDVTNDIDPPPARPIVTVQETLLSDVE